MAALATMADAEAFGYTLPPAPVGPGLLARASERVRGYTGQEISRVIDDVALIPVRNSIAFLPQLPADKPTVVKFDNVQFLENTAWYWDPIGSRICGINPYITSGNFSGWWWRQNDKYVEVTYSHGYAIVPDGIKEIVCSIANRMASTPAPAEGGTRQESAGGVSITYSSEALSSGANLTASEKLALDNVVPRRTMGTIPLRTW